MAGWRPWASFPHLTALKNVALAPKLVTGKSKAEAREIAARQLKHVGRGDKLDVYPSASSGGQQQRLALAMEPDYTLFDVATSALDPELVGEVLNKMRLLAEEGTTMICVTHEMRFARDVSERVAFFHEGIIEEIDTPANIFRTPKSEHLQKFLSNIR